MNFNNKIKRGKCPFFPSIKNKTKNQLKEKMNLKLNIYFKTLKAILKNIYIYLYRKYSKCINYQNNFLIIMRGLSKNLPFTHIKYE